MHSTWHISYLSGLQPVLIEEFGEIDGKRSRVVGFDALAYWCPDGAPALARGGAILLRQGNSQDDPVGRGRGAAKKTGDYSGHGRSCFNERAAGSVSAGDFGRSSPSGSVFTAGPVSVLCQADILCLLCMVVGLA